MKTAGCHVRYYKTLLALAITLLLLSVLALSTPARAAPAIAIEPASGAIGTRVTINGTVFDSYKGDNIYIFFDDTEIIGSPLTVDETGTFAIPFNIPDNAIPGRHWVEARTDVKSTSMLARSFFIVEEVGIKLNTVDGTVGTKVTVSGSGFYADRTVTIYYYNIIGEKLSTVTASPIGEFSHHFTIPNGTGGKHKITAENAEGNLAETQFEVIPSIAANLASAGPGELLTLSGTGFGYRGEVDISFDIYSVAKARTDEYGYFEVKFNIPKVRPDTYDIKALDEYDNVAKIKFTTTAGASLNQTGGSISSKLTASGSGFKAEKTVTVDYDNLRVATATTDKNGDFSATFDIPPSASGAHVITISDGETTKQFAFTVESEAPPVPGLLLPADSSETRAKAYLDWQDVTDPSTPVTYNLQVASDPNFSSLALEKEGLAGSEYTLSEEEELPAVGQEAPYYWRVKAVDSAGNASEWSDPRSFRISAPRVPELVAPAIDSKAETPVFFDWNDVTSLSPPLTYSLQVATDPNFTSLVLEKEGLADSEYTLSEEEELPAVRQEAPYYWRVKAVDSAGNASEWSDSWSFHIGFSFHLPGWATIILICIGAIIVGFLAFWVGRRTAFRSPV